MPCSRPAYQSVPGTQSYRPSCLLQKQRMITIIKSLLLKEPRKVDNRPEWICMNIYKLQVYYYYYYYYYYIHCSAAAQIETIKTYLLTYLLTYLDLVHPVHSGTLGDEFLPSVAITGNSVRCFKMFSFLMCSIAICLLCTCLFSINIFCALLFCSDV